MPIVEIEAVCRTEADFNQLSVSAIANALGLVFGSEPATVWVKLRFLGCGSYAENHATLEASDFPVFVSVLQAHAPQGEALAIEAMAITKAVASCLGRASQQIHVLYEPSAAGRQAFGGNVVR
jgi:phenylpyruvate tautomerase PptA (4-oxalocrotonate tautomerase family)